MRYLVTLTPLEPFLFGGDTTFGKKGDEEKGTYLVKSRQFPQQSAVLGMLKKEIMTQSGVLTRKVRGEWVDKQKKKEAEALVGVEKFDIGSEGLQDFGIIKSLGSIFLIQEQKQYIKKVDIDSYTYKDGLLESYNPEIDIYDNFVETKTSEKLSSGDIFKPIEQTGNKTGGEDDSLFKKTSYLLKYDFKFAFYLECEYELRDSIIHLGADRSSFKLEIREDNDSLEYSDENGYLTLMSDAYITLPIKEHCVFAITSEISFQSLQNKKHATKSNAFQKSTKIFLYEKGSVFINPSDELVKNLNNKNCQRIGYNKHTYEKGQNR
ncbi:MAG: type III-B CRISPR module-associated Cmr3 family protein [Campylobacterota bacterium]|nr:type III-B CRISPR module-associated Cmr3 family protein [Campylobacterota bacterium]